MRLAVIGRTLIIIALLALSVQCVYAQKTDIVILKNGDHITGEIQRLQVGIVRFKTDDLETINIKWDKIESVQTKNIYELELQSGMVFYGSIWPGDGENTLLVRSGTSDTRLWMPDVVRIVRIKETFWDRLGGYVRLGMNYTKASGIGQLSFGLKADYRDKSYYTDLTVSSVVTTKNQQSTSRKEDLFLSYQRYLGNKWFWSAIAGAEENTELGLDLRASIGGGIGKYFLQTNTNWLNGLAGIIMNREWYADSTKAGYNIEGLIAGQHELFIHDRPKLNLQTSLNVYPNISNLGRIRSDLNVDLDWEVSTDLFWVLSFYFNFDSRPVSNASRSDYRIETSFKYEI